MPDGFFTKIILAVIPSLCRTHMRERKIGPAGWFVAAALVVLLNHAAGASFVPPKPGATDLTALVNEMAQREIQANKRDEQHWRYRESIQREGKKKEVREVIQTSDGEVYRVLAIDGQTLNVEQNRAEEQRIETLTTHPAKAGIERKKLDRDTSTADDVLRMLPTAFRYECIGVQDTVVELKFSPNPNFRASGWLGTVVKHTTGSMWIDRRQYRLVRVDGHLTSGVKFGWGLVGRLNRGVTFSIKRQDVGGGNWEMVSIDLDLGGKALLFKNIALREKESFTNFASVPRKITTKEATGLLLRDDFATK